MECAITPFWFTPDVEIWFVKIEICVNPCIAIDLITSVCLFFQLYSKFLTDLKKKKKLKQPVTNIV